MEKLPDAEKENPGGDKEEYPDLDKPVEEENSYILYEEEVFAAYPEDKVTPGREALRRLYFTGNTDRGSGRKRQHSY